MAVTQLATSADVVAALGRALTSAETARVGAILDKASELFRRASGQRFTAGTSDVRLRAVGEHIYLTQHPVVSVQSVDDMDGEAVDYTLEGSRLVLGHPRGGEFFQVAYTHGGTVPDLVRLTIAEIAQKVLLIDPNALAGKVQHTDTAGPYSTNDTYATWAQGGQTMLAPADLEIAKSYRVRSYGPAAVMVP
jgi:hypothetical protein